MLHPSQRRKISYKAMQNVDFAAGVYLSEAPHPPLLWPHALPLLTHCIRVYSILTVFTQVRGGGEESWTREKVREATVHKTGSKIPTWPTVSPVYKLWLINTCRKVPLQVNFVRWRHFVLVSIKFISPWFILFTRTILFHCEKSWRLLCEDVASQSTYI